MSSGSRHARYTMTFEQRLEGAMVQWTSGEEYSGQRDEHGQRSCSGGVPGV